MKKIAIVVIALASLLFFVGCDGYDKSEDIDFEQLELSFEKKDGYNLHHSLSDDLVMNLVIENKEETKILYERRDLNDVEIFKKEYDIREIIQNNHYDLEGREIFIYDSFIDSSENGIYFCGVVDDFSREFLIYINGDETIFYLFENVEVKRIEYILRIENYVYSVEQSYINNIYSYYLVKRNEFLEVEDKILIPMEVNWNTIEINNKTFLYENGNIYMYIKDYVYKFSFDLELKYKIHEKYDIKGIQILNNELIVFVGDIEYFAVNHYNIETGEAKSSKETKDERILQFHLINIGSDNKIYLFSHEGTPFRSWTMLRIFDMELNKEKQFELKVDSLGESIFNSKKSLYILEGVLYYLKVYDFEDAKVYTLDLDKLTD